MAVTWRGVTAEQALLTFLEGSLGAKRDRILDFAGRPKARAKFLNLLYHQLGGLFRQSCVVALLPNAAWNMAAYRFRPAEEFGQPVHSLRAAYAEGSQNELVLTVDGRYGYWRDETYVDSEVLVIADSSASSSKLR